MAVINHAKREINAKLVYYGPAGSGKASLFRYIHQRIKPSLCGPLKSMPAGGDTLQFFDYLPFESASLDGYQVRFHLYTLTGPVTNPGTWRMTLKGVDGLAVVAEAGQEQDEVTLQSLRNLRTVLASQGSDLQKTPCVLISTKVDRLTGQTSGWGPDMFGVHALQSSCVTGEGVLQALAALSQEVLQRLRKERESALPAQETVEELSHEVLAEQVPFGLPAAQTEPGVELQPGGAATVEVPVTVQVAGQPRRFVVRVTLKLEEVADGPFGV